MATISGGGKLEAALAEIAKDLSKAATLSVGFMENATYPDAKGTLVPLVAAIQEFGAPARNIPPRPFFRNMIAEKSGEWPDAIAGLLASNEYDAEKTLMLAGEGIKGQLQQSILDTNSPPLSQATIDRKGFDKPLIDTSHMINSVDYNVK
jgi:hypothetical protein